MTNKTIVDAAASGTFAIGGDMTVNRIGFGAMRITGDGVWGEPKDVEGARKLLRRVVEIGVNFIDTADAFGPDVSERVIAKRYCLSPSWQEFRALPELILLS